MMMMSQFMGRVAAVVVVAVWGAVAAAEGVTTETISFHSKALDKETTYIAALPSPMEEGRHYPVLYLLHGATGSFKDWDSMTTLTEALEGRGMIVVMPDGGQYGWYLDSPVDAKSQYDSLITRDVREDVERRYTTRKDRAGRGIAGLSMGGHGAMSLAAKHPDLYGSASSLSGILDIAARPGNWRMREILGNPEQDMARWQEHSVYHLADRFTTAGVSLLFDTGVADETGAVEDARKLHGKLKELGVEHIYREFPGKHNWEYWTGHIVEHLDFHGQVFTTGQQRDE